VIDALREMVLESRPGGVPPEIGAFHQAFLDQIRSRGRVSELAFMTFYKVRSGEVFQDAAAGPPMVARGKLRPPERPIRGAGDVRRIFAACEAAGKEVR
jgi:hypothetical protein